MENIRRRVKAMVTKCFFVTRLIVLVYVAGAIFVCVELSASIQAALAAGLPMRELSMLVEISALFGALLWGTGEMLILPEECEVNPYGRKDKQTQAHGPDGHVADDGVNKGCPEKCYKPD